MKCFVTGAAGFIGSHLVDELIKQGHIVYGIDNFLTGDKANVNEKCHFYERDIREVTAEELQDIDAIFHLAAVARTQWCIDDPLLAHEINATGTLNMLLKAREAGVKRFIYSSSCIVYVPTTPYYISKMMAEEYVRIFHDLYGMSTLSLRYSNVYGSLRQSEKGPAINCIASLRKTKKETGKVWLTGDGSQTRDFIHVEDIVRANILAANSQVTGFLDICTGKQTSMKTIADYFNCSIEFVEARQGDVKHLVQNPDPAWEKLGFTYLKELRDHIQVYL